VGSDQTSRTRAKTCSRSISNGATITPGRSSPVAHRDGWLVLTPSMVANLATPPTASTSHRVRWGASGSSAGNERRLVAFWPEDATVPDRAGFAATALRAGWGTAAEPMLRGATRGAVLCTPAPGASARGAAASFVSVTLPLAAGAGATDVFAAVPAMPTYYPTNSLGTTSSVERFRSGGSYRRRPLQSEHIFALGFTLNGVHVHTGPSQEIRTMTNPGSRSLQTHQRRPRTVRLAHIELKDFVIRTAFWSSPAATWPNS
jgi:hypothetical protein